MLDRRAMNVKIIEDTFDLVKNNQVLTKALKKSRSEQKLYLESDEVKISEDKKQTCKTIVSKKRSFEAASLYAKEGKKVCVLNFASATNPGGGVLRGSSAQEESLCRCSTLYWCLDIDEFWQKFYTPHRKATNPLYNDDCIYTPDVVVVKTDDSEPKRMPENEWYQVDVLTCAAPNLRIKPSNNMNPGSGFVACQISDEELYKLHIKRIEKIFKIAIANGAEVLILGAFGCGAFKNPPEVVAKAFYDVQKKYEQYFETIEYAVFCVGSEVQNYEAFCEKFEQ